MGHREQLEAGLDGLGGLVVLLCGTPGAQESGAPASCHCGKVKRQQ